MKKKYVSILIFWTLVLMIIAVIPNVSAYDFPSTNEDNKNGTNPLRPGTIGPHVNLVEAGVGYVTLEFNMPEAYWACFEYRTDGDTSQSTGDNFNTEITDGLYPYYCLNDETRTETINANEYVEVRLVFGGERDWDFDWTRFDVETATTVGGEFITVDKTAVMSPYIAFIILAIIGSLAVVIYYKKR